jgi:hypothetical protein
MTHVQLLNILDKIHLKTINLLNVTFYFNVKLESILTMKKYWIWKIPSRVKAMRVAFLMDLWPVQE